MIKLLLLPVHWEMTGLVFDKSIATACTLVMTGLVFDKSIATTCTGDVFLIVLDIYEGQQATNFALYDRFLKKK